MRTHNNKVEEIARSYENKGYKVKAGHLKGYERPKPIGQYNKIPDIVAKKGNSTKIIEVDSKHPSKRDDKQTEAFKKSASQRYGTDFELVYYD